MQVAPHDIYIYIRSLSLSPDKHLIVPTGSMIENRRSQKQCSWCTCFVFAFNLGLYLRALRQATYTNAQGQSRRGIWKNDKVCGLDSAAGRGHALGSRGLASEG